MSGELRDDETQNGGFSHRFSILDGHQPIGFPARNDDLDQNRRVESYLKLLAAQRIQRLA